MLLGTGEPGRMTLPSLQGLTSVLSRLSVQMRSPDSRSVGVCGEVVAMIAFWVIGAAVCCGLCAWGIVRAVRRSKESRLAH